MARLQDVSKSFDQFKAAVSKNDTQAGKSLLAQLKLQLTQFTSLPPLFEASSTAQKELQLARDIFETAVFFSVQLNDEAAFERNFMQLKPYYEDTRGLLPASQQENIIIGLNLLRLLVQNRIAEFHTELELIPQQAQATPYISAVTQLERWLMEGAYNKVLAARSAVPHPSYALFLDKLLTTVRDEIASCSERAYTSLSVPEAQKLMLFSSDKEALKYAQERGWTLRDGLVTFSVEEKKSRDIPSLELINNVLTYARELERIV